MEFSFPRVICIGPKNCRIRFAKSNNVDDSSATRQRRSRMDGEIRLRALENESVFILREAYRKFPKLALLWSMGKDSTVMLWLARKAFFGRVPLPVVHIDT